MDTTGSYGSVGEKRSLIVHKNPKEYLVESPAVEFAAIVFGGSMLAFNAGFINVVSLLISDILVSHTTGNISKTSVYLAEGQYFKFLEVAIMLPCFVLGSFTTTLMIEEQAFHLNKAYRGVFLLGTIILLIAALTGIYTIESQLYAYLATFACGMQNAMTTKYSGSILRTTHTTGMATDIGICLGRIAKGKPNELWKLQVQIPLLLSFFVGGVAGCAAYAYLRKHAMFVCVGLFGGIGLLYIAVIAHFKEETYWDAMFGSEKTSSRMQSSGSTRTHDKSTSSSAKADSPPAIKPEATAAGAEEVYSTLHVEL